MASCIFKCDKTEELTSICGPKRIRTIICASKRRKDNFHSELESKLHENPELTVSCHRSCVSSYTSAQHIARCARKQSLSESSIQRRTALKRRSELGKFEFKEHCIFCGEECLLRSSKNPERWRVVCRCTTADRHDNLSFKDRILQHCAVRDDASAEDIRIRVSGAPADLHAANAQYHRDCHKQFFSERNTKAAQSATVSQSLPNLPNVDPSLTVVIGLMREQPARVWNSAELHQLYMEASGCKDKSTRHARRRLATKLSTHFGNELVVMRIDGCASLLCFRQYVPFHLNADVADGIDDNVVEQLAEQIRLEVKSIPIQKNYDITSFTYASAIEGTSNTLLSLIARLVSDGAVTKVSLSLAQSIQQHVAKWHNQTTLGLALKFHHRFGSKEAVDLLHDYGFAVTYDEVLRFRKSVAVHTASHTFATQLPSTEVPASGWFDNYDLNIFTPNGRRETHAMAIEFTQQKAASSTDSARACV